MTAPSEDDARAIAVEVTGQPPLRIRRFETGIAHWVYDVQPSEGDAIVIKIGSRDQPDTLDSTIGWTETLIPLGVPLPPILSSGTMRGLPYVVMPKLPGADLGLVYPDLTSSQKHQLATDVSGIQQRVHALPHADGFGFSKRLGTAPRPTWKHVLQDGIRRSRTRIEAANVASTQVLDPLLSGLDRLDDYFRSVRPVPFLDDTTTKNVLVHEGALSGIVDIDLICYGDPLFVIALTRTSLLNSGWDTDYPDAWAQLLDLTGSQQAALSFYTALFCADFLGELGHDFNGNNPPPTPDDVARLQNLLSENLLAI